MEYAVLRVDERRVHLTGDPCGGSEAEIEIARLCHACADICAGPVSAADGHGNARTKAEAARRFLRQPARDLAAGVDLREFIQIDTRNILFICGGAFDGIEKKIAARMNTMVVGFNASQNTEKIDRENFLQYIAPQDLKSFGLIPEIIGRLPVLTYLEPLDRAALRNILTEPKNAIIRQYIKLFELDGITLKFDEDVYEYIVDKAIEFRLGARGLRSICEAIMTDLMFEVPSQGKKNITITKAYAEEKMNRVNAQKLRA